MVRLFGQLSRHESLLSSMCWVGTHPQILGRLRGKGSGTMIRSTKAACRRSLVTVSSVPSRMTMIQQYLALRLVCEYSCQIWCHVSGVMFVLCLCVLIKPFPRGSFFRTEYGGLCCLRHHGRLRFVRNCSWRDTLWLCLCFVSQGAKDAGAARSWLFCWLFSLPIASKAAVSLVFYIVQYIAIYPAPAFVC